MALKCGIIGLSSTGKTTLFNCLSGTKASSGLGGGFKTNLGQIEVPDKRLDKLYEIEKPQKKVPTTIEIVDIPGLVKGSAGKKESNKFLTDISQTDALIHVVRCFDDDTIPHVEGSINPIRDKEIIELELIFKDLEILEKKLDKYKKASKSADKDALRGVEVISDLMKHLENGCRAATYIIDDNDKKFIDDCFLLSMKPVLYVCNVDDSSAVNGNKYVDDFKNSLEDETSITLIIAAHAEAEIAELDNEEERLEFLKDIGVDEPGVNKLIREAYNLLDLRTFFTAGGSKEVRAWTIKKGMSAPQAAGVIHSDLERGFIRAEVIKYDDFVTLGSENACKSAGKYKIEGKNYIVQDGDILNIRFNV